MRDQAFENQILGDIDTINTDVSNLKHKTFKIESDQAAIIANTSITRGVLEDIDNRIRSVIPITREMVVSYTKDFVNKLLNIASECYTDIKYECRNSYINLELRYYVGGNFIDININDNLLTYNNNQYNINKLFENTIQEKAILYDIKDKIRMFYKMNT